MQSRLLVFLFLLLGGGASAQLSLQGTVFDSSRNYTVESVIVQTSAGAVTLTNREGSYQVNVAEGDSVWFSFLGRPTRKYAVRSIPDISHFDISLRVSGRGSTYRLMKEVVVYGKNYRLDSLRNRETYAKAFDFRRPNLGTMTSIGPGGAGIDLDELIRVFQFRKNRNAERFRARLLAQEEEHYIDNRFTKALIRRLTGLAGADLDAFQERFRPSVEFTQSSSDYDFQTYIKLCYQAWSTGEAPAAPN